MKLGKYGHENREIVKALVGTFNKKKAIVAATLSTVKFREVPLTALLDTDTGDPGQVFIRIRTP